VFLGVGELAEDREVVDVVMFMVASVGIVVFGEEKLISIFFRRIGTLLCGSLILETQFLIGGLHYLLVD